MNEKQITKALAKARSLLSMESPGLPSGELKAYVQKYFDWAKEHKAMIEQEVPPFYLLDTTALRERAQQFKSAFSSVLQDTGFYFAVKSNSHPDVARTLLGCGFGLDVSSGVELEMALALKAEKIVFSGPGKTHKELTLAAENHKTVTVLMDSFRELENLEKIAADKGVKISAGVRLTTMPKGLWKKFGILLQDLSRFFRAAEACHHVQLKGLQFHTSWNMSPEAQIKFIRKIGRAASGLSEKHRKQIDFIDIGGGYWPEQGEWLTGEGTPEGVLRKALGMDSGSAKRHFRLPSNPIETFAESISQAIQKNWAGLLPCRVCFEPGRWVCNDAMHLILSVVDKKGNDLVITDAGTNTIGWERYETDYCPVLNLSRPSLKEKKCFILGSLCTPHDVWGKTYFGDRIEPCDFLVIPCQGAYTYSLRQEFIKPLPRVIKI
ncbi:MAG: decarboxylase [Desulfobacteraceae bacterium]|nr:decarboxylase [Desulfobacteraceae bacterium]MBU4002705.1 alanine racemase [Pseudomonadota bacterium]MBU4055475.1 alanine racemase [Pseudomonadota bacterium]